MPKLLKDYYIYAPHPLNSLKGNPDKDKVKGWIRNAGGVPQRELDENTTHCVVEEKFWNNQTLSIKKVLEENEDREPGKKIKIVDQEWLYDMTTGKSKVKEARYSWPRPEEADGGKKKSGRKGGDDGSEPRTAHGILAQELQRSTRGFADPAMVKRMNEENELAERIREERAMREKAKKEMAKSEKAAEKKRHQALLRSGAIRAAAEIFSENHHIYQDFTGFSYDVKLTKVDTRSNSNQRLTITIYESNEAPHTYATNLHSAGTFVLQPTNNILAVVGTNFITALGAFQKAFKENTGLHWDNRVTGHNSRVHERLRARQDGNRALAEAEVEEKWFRYMPPAYGARGIMQRVTDEVPETLIAARERGGGVEDWMRFTDDAIIEPQSRSSDVGEDGAAEEEQEEVGYSAGGGDEAATADHGLGDLGFPFDFNQPMQMFDNQESTNSGPEPNWVFAAEAANGVGELGNESGADQVNVQAFFEGVQAVGADVNALGAMSTPLDQGDARGFVEPFNPGFAVLEPTQQQYVADYQVLNTMQQTIGQETADAAAVLDNLQDFHNMPEGSTMNLEEMQPVDFGEDFNRGLANMSIPRMSSLPEELQPFGAGSGMAESLDFLNGPSVYLKQEEHMSNGPDGMGVGDPAESEMPSLGKRKRDAGEIGDEGSNA